MNNASEGGAMSVAETHRHRSEQLKALLAFFEYAADCMGIGETWGDSAAVVVDKYFSLIWPSGLDLENHDNPKDKCQTRITGASIKNYAVASSWDGDEDGRHCLSFRLHDSPHVRFSLPVSDVVAQIKSRCEAEAGIAGLAQDNDVQSQIEQYWHEGGNSNGDDEADTDDGTDAGYEPVRFDDLTAVAAKPTKSNIDAIERRIRAMPVAVIPGRKSKLSFAKAKLAQLEITLTNLCYNQSAVRFELYLESAEFKVLVGAQGPIEVKCASNGIEGIPDGDLEQAVWNSVADLMAPPIVRADGTVDLVAAIDAYRMCRPVKRLDDGYYNLGDLIRDANADQLAARICAALSKFAYKTLLGTTLYSPEFRAKDADDDGYSTISRVLVHPDRYEIVLELQHIGMWQGKIRFTGFAPNEARVTLDARDGVTDIRWIGQQRFDNGQSTNGIYRDSWVLDDYIRDVVRLAFGIGKDGKPDAA